ncbi:MAG: DegV family protein [Oscillospiraceae bacterium]|nr:DegV family protein [Oscillospiraceae bacterium]MCL2277975.1 DegV family protein [Oscillospiraceae bacterium]
MYQIVSDGGCDFSPEEVKKSGVAVVPFYVSFDQQTYMKEGVDITKEVYFERLMSEKTLFPKTSQPTPQDYIDVLKPFLDEGKDIFLFTISSKLSGSFASTVIAKDMLSEDYPDRKIELIDSFNVSIGQGLILREIVKMRDAGYSLEKTVEETAKVIKSTHVYFTLNTLEYLKRGGRIGPTTALVGGILGLSPILQVENGEVSQLDNVRGRKRALQLIEAAMVDALKDDLENINMSIGHIVSEEDAIAFKANTEAALSIKIPNPITEIGVTVGSHAGPGALAFAYCKKYDKVS